MSLFKKLGMLDTARVESACVHYGTACLPGNQTGVGTLYTQAFLLLSFVTLAEIKMMQWRAPMASKLLPPTILTA